MERKVAYSVGDRGHVGTFTAPSGRVRAAVVLLPDWRGMSPLAREHARRLVELGCAVLVADLYGDEFTPTHAEQVGPLVQRLLEQSRQASFRGFRLARRGRPSDPSRSEGPM